MRNQQIKSHPYLSNQRLRATRILLVTPVVEQVFINEFGLPAGHFIPRANPCIVQECLASRKRQNASEERSADGHR